MSCDLQGYNLVVNSILAFLFLLRVFLFVVFVVFLLLCIVEKWRATCTLTSRSPEVVNYTYQRHVAYLVAIANCTHV